eukprot:scaffold22485_cov149-Skeletonema_marinoi.AAC.1
MQRQHPHQRMQQVLRPHPRRTRLSKEIPILPFPQELLIMCGNWLRHVRVLEDQDMHKHIDLLILSMRRLQPVSSKSGCAWLVTPHGCTLVGLYPLSKDKEHHGSHEDDHDHKEKDV